MSALSRFAFTDSKKNAITDEFLIKEQLGAGKFSIVKKAVNKKSGEEVAIKIINKRIVEVEELVKEVAIMKEIDEHPGVIHLKDVYEDEKNFYIVIDLVTGGELFDKIVELEFYSEKSAAGLMHQIVSVVAYLHNKDIVHRDLKPENLLFEDKTAVKLKLCDFGLAEIVTKGTVLQAVVGSPTYMAPEILAGTGYGKQVDMYSIGVIMYILLCGYPPFEPEEGIVDLEFPSPEWDGISDAAKQLITLLLDKDPNIRPSSAQMLEHSWVRGTQASSSALVGTIRTMKTFNTVRRTGGTMRQTNKPAAQPQKGSVFALFGNPNPSQPAQPTQPVQTQPTQPTQVQPTPTAQPPKAAPKATTPAATSSPSTTKTKEPKKKASNDKVTATPTAAPKKTDVVGSNQDKRDNYFSFAVGEASLRDIRKRMQDLKDQEEKQASTRNEERIKEREQQKIIEELRTEKVRRSELEDKSEDLSRKLEVLERGFNEASSRRKDLERDLDAVVRENRMLKQELDQEKDLRKEYETRKTKLETDIVAIERDRENEKQKRAGMQRDYETMKHEVEDKSKKLVDATKQVRKLEQSLKVENATSDKLQTKKIEELEAKVKTLEEKLKQGGGGSGKSKREEDLEKVNKSLLKEVEELKTKVTAVEEEKLLLKWRIEELQHH